RSDVIGRSLLCQVEDYGPEDDEDGVMLVDGPTGQQHFFSQVENLAGDVPGTVMGNIAFSAVDDGAGIWMGPQGRPPRPAPVPNRHVAAFVAAGPTLFILLKKAQGTPVRRLVGLDPIHMGFRFDCGEQGSEPDDNWERQVQTNGYIAVVVATPNDDENECEL